MSKLETNTIDTISGSTNLTLGGTNATDITIPSGVTVAGFKSTGIDDNATSTAITINSSEQVGIGTTSPASTLEISKSDRDNGCTLSITNAHTGTDWEAGDIIGTINFRTDDTSTTEPIRGQVVVFDDASGASSGAPNNSAMKFSTALNDTLSERMRIDSSGNVLIGIASLPDTGDNGISLTTAGIAGLGRFAKSGTGSNTHIQFYNGNGNVGTITTSGSATAYNTSSDYRLKENVSYDFDATTRLKQLKPARFNFIANADTTVDGFLAHEVSSVVPEAITGTKDAVDENGNPVYQGIDQSKLVPLLVKTIQELEARITALENA